MRRLRAPIYGERKHLFYTLVFAADCRKIRGVRRQNDQRQTSRMMTTVHDVHTKPRLNKEYKIMQFLQTVTDKMILSEFFALRQMQNASYFEI